ncbi:hypothetical protein GCM10008927_20200 [Amylibacter ulvae]|uniref:Aminoglycoside phosphotransferase domain-containing protein n=1 Tax=Paramylibacter ulvae TaxID=1651968 RepID=A0ABQ3D3S1_9RHOB|nr:aminoglycoside phosphotransferase family protein [Amylibacter ulvae]GHA54356.1 hypothetical protein GCM10008927_20200 [Amylibacter ulvae]
MSLSKAHKRAELCVADFQQTHFCEEKFTLKRLNGKTNEVHDHHVFLMKSSARKLVLKLCFIAREKHGLGEEFSNLENVYKDLGNKGDYRVPKPIAYCDEPRYFVCEYIAGKTFFDLLNSAKNNAERDKLFTKLGEFTAALHLSTHVETRPFWPKFYMSRLSARWDEVKDMDLWKNRNAGAYVNELRKQMKHVRGRDVIKVSSHGDLHARNVMLDSNAVWGIDFAGAGHMMNVIDVTGLMIAADCKVPTLGGALSDLGLVQSHQDAFFNAYAPAGEVTEVMAFSMRANMLRTWVGYSDQDYTSTKKRKSFALMEARVKHAFGD